MPAQIEPGLEDQDPEDVPWSRNRWNNLGFRNHVPVMGPAKLSEFLVYGQFCKFQRISYIFDLNSNASQLDKLAIS